MDRLEILNRGSTLWLAVEGRHTNLRIWLSHDGNGKLPIDTVFMRLDKAHAYSAPFDQSSFKYLHNPPKEIQSLLENGFEFKSPITQLPAILSIVESLSIRPDKNIVAW